MNWWTVIATAITAIGGPAAVLKVVGDRLLEKQKDHHVEQMAEIAHERAILLAEKQNAFSMGATSHMATVVFDKYVEFCEEYVETMSNAVYTLVQVGAKQPPLNARDLVRIRRKWALWLPEDIEANLDWFEDRLPRLGSEAPVQDADGGYESSIESSVKSVIADLRKFLATEELTTLRSDLVSRSSVRPAPRL